MRTAQASYFPFATAGNIGVGTTAPAAKLHIGDAGSAPNAMPITGSDLYVKGNIEFDGKIYGDGSLLTNLSSTTGWTVSGQNVYTSGTGNVGIGTTIPNAPLNVAGNLTASSGREYGLNLTPTINQSGTAGYTALNINSTVNTTGSAANLGIVVSTNGAGVFGVGFDGAIETATGFKNNSSISYAYYAATTAGPAISRNRADAVPALVVTNSNASSTGDILQLKNSSSTPFVVSQGGNVGIGTTGPAAYLDIDGQHNSQTSFRINGFDNDATTYAMQIIDENTGGDVFSLRSNAVEANPQINMYVSGNVGIGTGAAVPVARLEIRDTKTHVSGDLAGTDAILRLYNEYGSDVAEKGAVIAFEDKFLGTTRTTRAAIKGGTATAGNTADGFLSFYTDSGTANSMQERMRINQAGNVGIATTLPLARLDLVGAGTTSATPSLIVRDSGKAAKLAVLDNGNVGIGTISPSQLLEVSAVSSTDQILLKNRTVPASAQLQASPALLLNGYLWNSAVGARVMSGGLQMNSYSNNTNPSVSKLSFLVGAEGNAPTEKMYINSDGKFYIAGGADFSGTSLSDSNSVYIRNTAAATSGGAQSSNKLILEGRAWNSAQGSMPDQAVFQVINNNNNANPTTDRLAISVASANNSPSPLEVMSLLSNGNVGIGTTAPLAKLDLLSPDEESATFRTTTDTNVHLTNNTSGEVYLQVSNATTGTNAWMYGMDDDETFRIGYGGKGEITDGNSKFTILQSGNVGVGTYVPRGILDIVGAGTTSATSALIIRDSTKAVRSAFLNNGNVGIGTSGPSATLEVQRTGGIAPLMVSSANLDGDYLVVDAGGNVGIGNASPLVKLHVNGSAIIQGTSTSGTEGELVYDTSTHYYKYYDGSTWQQIAGGAINYSGTLWTQVGNYLYYNAGYVAIGTTYPDNLLTLSQMADSDGIKLNGFDDMKGSYGQIHITSSGDMRIKSNGEQIFDIAGTNAIANASNFTHYRTLRLDDNIPLSAGIGSDYSLGYNSADDTFRIADGANLTSAPRMTMNASGNVGIGVTAPRTNLDVYNSGAGFIRGLKLANNPGSDEDGVYMQFNTATSPNTNDNYGPYIGSRRVSGGSGHLVFGTGAAATPTSIVERMRITNEGNVGIGSTIPGAALEVRDIAANARPLVLRDGYYSYAFGYTPYSSGSSYTLAIGANSTIPGMYFAGGSFDLRGSGNSVVFSVRGNNVGIGTTAPLARLQLGSGTPVRAVGLFMPGADSMLRNIYLGHGAGTAVVGTDDSSKPIVFEVGGSERARITNDGNVGIGSTAPSTTLQVASSGTNGVVIGSTAYPSWMGSNGLYVSGAFRANSYLVGSGSAINWGASQASILGYNPSTGSDTYLSFYTGGISANGERMRIIDNGNIGIGTTDPKANVHVYGGAARLRVGPWFSSNDRDYVELIAGSTDTQIVSPNERFHINNPTGALVLQASGANVGVGTTAPLSTLEIAPAGTLAIPQGAAPAVANPGQIAVDTTNDQLIYYGSAKRVVPYAHTRCMTIEAVAATDDNVPMGSFNDGVTIGSVWCTCSGTCTTKATFALEDGSGNAMTITGTNPVCTDIGTVPTAAAVTAGNQLTARESMRFDVTNTPSPETDTYELCVSFTVDAQ